jgi:D-erythro-7,8-dihydroneopterin triphosphate epimerase
VDKIVIRDIALRCIIGIYPEERREKQDVVITVTLNCDLTRAGATDDFQDTVDYKAVKQAIVGLVESSEFQLVEALAQAIANACLAFDRVEQVDVTVEKPGALRFARTVAVEISRKRGG